MGALQPYVGLGVNYTICFEEKTVGALRGLNLSLDNSVGVAAQVGADYALNKDWFVNADVRRINIGTTATVQSIGSFDVTINPWVFTLGVGRRF